MTPYFPVRTTILKELMADKEFTEKLEKATKMLQVELALRQYAKKTPQSPLRGKHIKTAEITEKTKS